MTAGTVRIHLESAHWSGEYVARLADVEECLRAYGHSKRRMVSWIADLWPEIASQTGAKRFLHQQNVFVLAVILRQL